MLGGDIGEYEYLTKKIIKSVNDLLSLYTPNVNNEIELENCVYEIDSKDLDLGIYKLVASVPVVIKGFSQGLNKIKTTEDNTSLISTTSDLFLFNIQLEATGTNSKAIEMNGSTGFESLDMKYVQFGTNTKYGTLTNIRQGYWSDGFSFNAKQGFDLNGTIGGFTIFNTRIVNTGDYIIKTNTGYTINNIRSNINCDISTGSVAFDVDYVNINNDEGLQLTDGTYSGTGSIVSPFTTGDTTEAHKSRKSLFKGNVGNLNKNTRVGGEWVVGTEVVTVLTFNTPTKLLGTTIYSNLQHITQTTDNAYIHNSTLTFLYDLDGNINLDGGPNDIIRLEIRKWVNSTSSYVVEKSYRKNVSNVLGGQDRVNFIPKVSNIEMNENDRIELWVVNETDGTNVTMLESSFTFLQKV